MATTSAVNGASVKNDGATILHAGTIASTRFTNLALSTNLDPNSRYGTKVVEPVGVSPAASGNLGTRKALAGGVFGDMEVGEYVGKVIGTRIAQTDNDFLQSGAAETSSRRMLHYARGNYRYHITDWSYTTGQATKGGSAGQLFTYVNPEGGAAIAVEPAPTNDTPGRLVYKEPKYLPVQDTYKSRTN